MTCPRCLGEGWIVAEIYKESCCRGGENGCGTEGCCGPVGEPAQEQRDCPVCTPATLAERADRLQEHFDYDDLGPADFVMLLRDGVPLREVKEMDLPF